MVKKRKKIDKTTTADLLYQCRNTCPLCQNQWLPLQIHHIDQNPYNNDFDNLIPLCLNCHAMVHNKNSMSQSFTPELLLRYRNELIKFYDEIREETKLKMIAMMTGEDHE